MIPESISTLSRRVFFPIDVKPLRDKYGFISAFQGALDADDLFRRQLVLIVAPPWTGKSFVAKQLEVHLRWQASDGPKQGAFGKFFHRTNFEHDAPEAVVPSWWEEWRKSDSKACWIVDAIDEDAKDRSRGTHHVLGLAAGLSPSDRARLCILMLGRENEIPNKVRERLQEIYGAPSDSVDSPFQETRLALLDIESAREFVRNEEAFSHVLNLIVMNRLQSIAGYPSVLDRLQQYEPEESVTSNQIWKDVVLDLIRDKNADGLLLDQTTIDEQFLAASRIAAILTFGNCDAVDDGHGTTAQPSVDALVRRDHADGALFNKAAREVLSSTIFRRSLGSLRFAQHHVQQWLAAFGVADMSLLRIRPLVTDAKGDVLQQHSGVLGLLVNTTKHTEVRNWIVSKYGGIPPRPDAAPWDLQQALAALDRLQTISKMTVWGLSLWDDRGLAQLATPGLATELANRIANRSLANQERELVIDVALAVGAKEGVPAAVAIARDSTEDGHLRVSATTLALKLGGEKEWNELGEYVRTLTSSVDYEISLKTIVVQWMYDKKLWDLATAAKEAPPRDSRTKGLHYRLKASMTQEDARTFLKELDVETFLRTLSAKSEKHEIPGVDAELVLRAIELLSGQEAPSEDDLRLLLPIALSLDRPEWSASERPYLSAQISMNQAIRRELIEKLAVRPPRDDKRLPWQAAQVLAGEDAAWLIELAGRRGTDQPWLWDLLLRLASYPGVSPAVRDTARAKVEEALPGEIERFDKIRAETQRLEKEYEEEAQKGRAEREKNTFELTQLVDSTLANDDLPLKQKAIMLSWFCLVGKAYRPTNVIGDWKDLGADRQEAVIAVAAQSLHETEPTPIPDGNRYSAWIAYEAASFASVLRSRTCAFSPNSEMVRKWLPGTVAFYEDVRDEIIRSCHAASPEATEDVLLEEFRRRLRSDPSGMYVAEQLADEFWTARFSAEVAKLVADNSYGIDGRTRLFRALTIRARAVAHPIVMDWLASTDAAQRTAAIDLLFCLDSERAWTAMKAELALRGKPAMLAVRSLLDQLDGLTTDLATWRSEILEDFYCMLMTVFPPSEDPVYDEDVVARGAIEEEYRDLRKSLPNLLLSRGMPDDISVLNRLATRFPSLKTWLDARRAEQDAGAVLAELDSDNLSVSPGTVPWEKVARVIESGVYRILRASEDLQAVLVEEIGRICADAKEHLSLLYYPRKARKSKGRKMQQTLQEDALQAYFYCRLSDRLAGRVLDRETKVIINREPLATKDQRLDIKVQAPTVDGKIATVVVELKWSDNAGVSTSLAEQLAKEYLAGAGLTHGIYLVGWVLPGKWKDTSISGPANVTARRLAKLLFLSGCCHRESISWSDHQPSRRGPSLADKRKREEIGKAEKERVSCFREICHGEELIGKLKWSVGFGGARFKRTTQRERCVKRLVNQNLMSSQQLGFILLDVYKFYMFSQDFSTLW